MLLHLFSAPPTSGTGQEASEGQSIAPSVDQDSSAPQESNLPQEDDPPIKIDDPSLDPNLRFSSTGQNPSSSQTSHASIADGSGSFISGSAPFRLSRQYLNLEKAVHEKFNHRRILHVGYALRP